MMKKMISLLLILILTLGAVSALADPPTQTEGIDVPVIDDIKKFEIPDNEAMAFVKDMKCGWNLGNTFDAYNGYVASVKGIEMDSGELAQPCGRKLPDQRGMDGPGAGSNRLGAGRGHVRHRERAPRQSQAIHVSGRGTL